ncbi:hypothetical protein STEG23_033560 [Scotinomys teguina]
MVQHAKTFDIQYDDLSTILRIHLVYKESKPPQVAIRPLRMGDQHLKTQITLTKTGTWKQPRYPSTEEWIRKMWYIYTMEHYTAEKNNDIMKFAGKWMDLENVILSEGIFPYFISSVIASSVHQKIPMEPG